MSQFKARWIKGWAKSLSILKQLAGKTAGRFGGYALQYEGNLGLDFRV